MSLNQRHLATKIPFSKLQKRLTRIPECLVKTYAVIINDLIRVNMENKLVLPQPRMDYLKRNFLFSEIRAEIAHS